MFNINKEEPTIRRLDGNDAKYINNTISISAEDERTISRLDGSDARYTNSTTNTATNTATNTIEEPIIQLLINIASNYTNSKLIDIEMMKNDVSTNIIPGNITEEDISRCVNKFTSLISDISSGIPGPVLTFITVSKISNIYSTQSQVNEFIRKNTLLIILFLVLMIRGYSR